MAVSGTCLLCSSICQVGVLNTLKESQSAYLEDFVIQHAWGMTQEDRGGGVCCVYTLALDKRVDYLYV